LAKGGFVVALRAGRHARKGSPVVEVLPPDELPAASPAESGRAERDTNGRFQPGNRAAKMRRAKTTVEGLRVDTSCAAYRPFGRWGRRYGAHRRTELAQAHGGSISAGVGALVESAALALAASRYLYDLASAKGDDPSLFVTAARLATDARQHELAAWELGSREAVGRRTSGTSTNLVLQAGLARIAAAQEERRRLREAATGGGEELETRVSNPVEAEPEGSCTRCGSDWPRGEATCPQCGEVES